MTMPGGPVPLTIPGGPGPVQPAGPAGSLALVKTEVLKQDYKDKWGGGCQYSATSVTCSTLSDERGDCGGLKDRWEIQ